MIALRLTRIEKNVSATYGLLLDEENRQIAVTLEPPDHDNARDISCVPSATYTAKRRFSLEHGGELFGLVNVPNRDDVEMHIGCLPRDTKGCVLLGLHFGFVDYADGNPGASGPGILESHAAFKQFMDAMTGVDEFMLAISDPPQ